MHINMIIDIFVNHFIGHIAAGYTEISTHPKMPPPIAFPLLSIISPILGFENARLEVEGFRPIRRL